ncbi:MAG: methylated-DNA--[protein]-cysteine S-methyltransferase [Actinomycetota bacterium]|nr:methylated-DNA--[protein]-cysteine S-methyltransferase [Actinomycetota bacterium]
MTNRHSVIDTAIGEITVVADDAALIGLYFPHHWYPPAPDTLGPLVDATTDPLFSAVAEQLDEYLVGRRSSFDLPVTLIGDDFQQQVWALLDEIPYGDTTTYGAIADRLGNKALAQRVGQAVGHNPVSVIVPCHRVVGSTGKLTGYAGGLDRKRLLLELEEPAEAKAVTLF